MADQYPQNKYDGLFTGDTPGRITDVSRVIAKAPDKPAHVKRLNPGPPRPSGVLMHDRNGSPILD